MLLSSIFCVTCLSTSRTQPRRLFLKTRLYLGSQTRWIWRCEGHRGGKGCWDWSLPLRNTSRRCYTSAPGQQRHSKTEKRFVCILIFTGLLLNGDMLTQQELQHCKTCFSKMLVFLLPFFLPGEEQEISSKYTSSATSALKLIQFGSALANTWTFLGVRSCLCVDSGLLLR